MSVFTTILTAILLGLGSTQAAVNPKCGSSITYDGYLATNRFANKTGQLNFRPYAFNYRNELSFYHTTKHPLIHAQFQLCTPNYQGGPNKEFDDLQYGRIYLPETKSCLAVTNPSGSPPYYLASKPCLNSAAGEEHTNKSIPYNFVYDSTDIADIRWVGATIPSKNVYQGPNPPAQYCFGQYFVNSTNLQHGYNFNGIGEPNTSGGDEAYRIHLYCNEKKGGKGSTGFNTLALVGKAQLQ